jgi:hypothetical protein
MCGKETGDPYALQKVFARPAGKLELREGDGYSGIKAENRWMWEDTPPHRARSRVLSDTA